MDDLETLRRELGVDLSWEHPGLLAVAGALPRLADKKRALGRIVALPGLTGVIDGLTVTPERSLDDDAIRDDLRDALLENELFRRCVLFEIMADGQALPLLAPAEPLGELAYEVQDGVVIWRGVVADLLLRRLAHVMAWWVPGVRDVADRLEAPDDYGDGLAEAVRLAHGRDPFLAGCRIGVTARDGEVVLSGQVTSPEQRIMAEDDAWAVWDVAEVVNRLSVAR